MAYADPLLEGLHTVLCYHFSNAIRVYLKYIIVLRSYSQTQKRKLKQNFIKTKITSRQLRLTFFVHLLASSQTNFMRLRPLQ